MCFKKAYGAPGVVKIVEILQREILTAMRLLGVSSRRGLKPEMVCVSSSGIFDDVAHRLWLGGTCGLAAHFTRQNVTQSVFCGILYQIITLSICTITICS